VKRETFEQSLVELALLGLIVLGGFLLGLGSHFFFAEVHTAVHRRYLSSDWGSGSCL
jgi:hypothetical protein